MGQEHGGGGRKRTAALKINGNQNVSAAHATETRHTVLIIDDNHVSAAPLCAASDQRGITATGELSSYCTAEQREVRTCGRSLQ